MTEQLHSQTQHEQQYSSEQVATILDENRRLKEQYNYDNEWITFLAKLAENESVKDIVEFIAGCQWTDRQKHKIMSFSKIVLGRGLATTYLSGFIDYRRAIDDYELCEAELILGMTCFDITPEWIELLDLITKHHNLELRRSKGAHFVENLGKQRIEVSHDEPRRDAQGFKEKLWQKFTGD